MKDVGKGWKYGSKSSFCPYILRSRPPSNWIKTGCTDTTNSWPTNYSSNNRTSYSAGNGGCGCAVGTYNYEGTTQDPDSFTLSSSEQWLSTVIAVYPVGATVVKDTISVALKLIK